jgi:hypothetical protein
MKQPAQHKDLPNPPMTPLSSTITNQIDHLPWGMADFDGIMGERDLDDVAPATPRKLESVVRPSSSSSRREGGLRRTGSVGALDTTTSKRPRREGLRRTGSVGALDTTTRSRSSREGGLRRHGSVCTLNSTTSSTEQDPNDVPPPVAEISFRLQSPGALNRIRNCLKVKPQDLLDTFHSPRKTRQPRQPRSPGIFQQCGLRSRGEDVKVSKQVKSNECEAASPASPATRKPECLRGLRSPNSLCQECEPASPSTPPPSRKQSSFRGFRSPGTVRRS